MNSEKFDKREMFYLSGLFMLLFCLLVSLMFTKIKIDEIDKLEKQVTAPLVISDKECEVQFSQTVKNFNDFMTWCEQHNIQFSVTYTYEDAWQDWLKSK